MIRVRVIGGAEEFLAASKRLKAAGDLGLRRELHTAVRRAARPLIAQTRAAALAQLPQRGGLARRFARNPQRVQARTGATTAGVGIVMPKAKAGSKIITEGRLRHPVFGRRLERWVEQQVSGTWWDETLEAGAPLIRREISAAIQRTMRRAEG